MNQKKVTIADVLKHGLSSMRRQGGSRKSKVTGEVMFWYFQ